MSLILIAEITIPMTIRRGISCSRNTQSFLHSLDTSTVWAEYQTVISNGTDNSMSTTKIPDQQRIVALNLQYDGHRVTVSVTPSKLARELSFSLPGKIRLQLQGFDKGYQPRYRDSSGCFESNLLQYCSVCSCGQNACQHVEYATQHIQLLQHVSLVIEEYQQKLNNQQVEMIRIQHESDESQQKIGQLEQDMERLGNSIGELDKKKEAELKEVREEVELKQLELEQEVEDKERLEQEKEYLALTMEEEKKAYQENISALNSCAWETTGSTKAGQLDISPGMNVPSLTPSQLDPSEKYEKNVDSTHHRAKHTHKILKKLARVNFVRKLGLERRQPVKQGKVCIDSQQVQGLKLLVSGNAECDVIRITTTAESKLQQVLAAHQVADMFEVEVQYPY